MAVTTEQAISQDKKPIKLFHYGLLLAVMLSWGVAFVGMKQMVKDAPPFQAGGLRFFVASLPLLIFALRPSRFKKLTRTDFKKFLVLGLLQTTLLFGINFTALQFVPAGITSIIINTHPFFVAILAHLFLKGDRLNRQKILGLVIGFSGVMFLVLVGKSFGELAFYWPIILLGSAVVWGTGSVLTKKFEIRDPMSLTAFQNLFGSLPLLIIGFGFESKPINWNWSFTLWLIYCAFVASSFAWWAWAFLLQTYTASRVSVFAFLVPVFGVLSGVILLNESLTFNMLVGGSLVALGIVVVNFRRQTRSKAVESLKPDIVKPGLKSQVVSEN